MSKSEIQIITTKKTNYATVKTHVLSNYKVGDKLPGEGELSSKLGTSYYAALRALRELAEEGFVSRKTRLGSFMVSHRPIPKIKNGMSMIAFVADELKYFVEVMSAIEEHYRDKVFKIGLVSSDYNSKLEISHLESLQRNGFAGAIIRLSEHTSSVEAIRKLFKNNFPIVLIENMDTELNIPCVQTDDEKAIYDATKYLIELGHRRIAHIAYGGSLADIIQAIPARDAGYRRALSEAGINIRKEYIAKVTNYNIDLLPPSKACLSGPGYGYDTMHKLLCLSDPPTAVVSGSHWLGIPSIRAIHDHGLKVPEDVSVIEMGDSEAAMHCFVPITVMNERKMDIGYAAADILERLLKGHKVAHNLVKIDANLVVRKSTAPPKD